MFFWLVCTSVRGIFREILRFCQSVVIILRMSGVFSNIKTIQQCLRQTFLVSMATVLNIVKCMAFFMPMDLRSKKG